MTALILACVILGLGLCVGAYEAGRLWYAWRGYGIRPRRLWEHFGTGFAAGVMLATIAVVLCMPAWWPWG